MFQIEKRIIQNELKYKGSVIVKYQIEYPQVLSNIYDTRKFNSINYQKALSLEKYAKETLFLESIEQYEYNVANGYPIMTYELYFQLAVYLYISD